MRVSRVLRFVVLASCLAGPAAAQVAPRGVRVVQNNPRLMVANPHVFNAADSAQSVALGDGMRQRMEKVAGSDWTVIERKQMNEALQQYAYPPDAILTASVARTLGQALQARLFVTSTMTRGEGGRYTVTSRLAGMNDDAGSVVAMAQAAGQRLETLGAQLADAFEPAIKAQKDAKACMDQRSSKPDKAADAAREALKRHPGNGLASYCLAQLAADRKQADSALVWLTAASKADPLSLPVWTGLAVQHQQRGDSAKVIEDFQQMLLIAPTNQKLREEAFKLFLNYGRADAARKVADEGLAIDPSNADLYDLKSNACLFAGDFPCAIDALEQVFTNDSTKADSLFYTKITVAASQQPDTTRLLKWARMGSAKYPTNVPLLEQLAKAYGFKGQPDSVIAVTNRAIALDSTNTTAALQTAKYLTDSTVKRPRDAIPFADVAIAKGDAQAKENAAAILTAGSAPLLQEPQDLEGAYTMLKKALATQPQGRLAATANYLFGFAAFLQVPKIDPEAEAQKSCDLARKEQGLLGEAEAGFTAGRSVNEANATKFLGFITQYKPRADALVKSFCK